MGGDELGALLVEFKADLSDLDRGAEQAKRKLGEVDRSAKETGGGFKDLLKNATSFATGMAVFNVAGEAVGFLKDQLGGVFQESMDAQAGMALTNAVLKSTHDASGETAQSVADLAGNLSHLTKFSDDKVQSGENMLLTFTNISKNVFPEATRTILDMSQALGQDLKSTAIEAGKALNDPRTGITALQRVGVTFNQTQKDQIKNFMDTNQIARAQGVILKELQREFGGAAEAAGKTFGGQMVIAGQYVADFKQTLGDDLMPIVTEFLGVVEKDGLPILKNFSDWFTKEGTPALKDVAGEVGPLVRGVEDFTGALFDMIKKSGAFQSVFQTIKDTLPAVEQAIGKVGGAVGKLLPPMLDLIKNFSGWIDKSGILTDGLHLLGDGVSTVADILGPFIQDISNVFNWLSKNKPATDALKEALVGVGVVLAGMKVKAFVGDLLQMADTVKNTVAKAIDKLVSGELFDLQGAKGFGGVASAAKDAEIAEIAVGTTAKTTMAGDVIQGSLWSKESLAGIGVSAETAEGKVAAAGVGMKGALAGAAGVAGGLLSTLSLIGGVALGEFLIADWVKNTFNTPSHVAPQPNWVTHHNPADDLAKAKQEAKELDDQINHAWKDMEGLGDWASKHNRILGNMLDPLDVTKADVQVQVLKAHADDLAKPPYELKILTPQVIAARQKIIDLKSHIDDLKGPESIGVLTPQVATARQKVIDLKSHIDDLHNPVALSIGTRSVDAAIGSVMYLKSQLNDLPSPTISVSRGEGHARGYASTGFAAIGQPFMFNEQGPELGMAVPGGVQIWPHSDSMNMLGGGSGGDIINEVHVHLGMDDVTHLIMTEATSTMRRRGRNRR